MKEKNKSKNGIKSYTKHELTSALREMNSFESHREENDLIPPGHIQFILSTIEFNKIVRLD